MVPYHSNLKRQILESILGNSYEEYVNFQRSYLLPKKRQHRQRVPLWQFLLQLLHFDGGRRFIEWSSAPNLEFRIRDPSGVAELWGSIKDKGDMTYEKFGRALRYYYGKNIIEKVYGRRYFYKFIYSRKTKNFINKFTQTLKNEADGTEVTYMTQLVQPIQDTNSDNIPPTNLSLAVGGEGFSKLYSEGDCSKGSGDESDTENDVFSSHGSCSSQKDFPDRPSASPGSSCSDDAYCSDEFLPPLPIAFDNDNNSGIMDLAWQDWKMYKKNGTSPQEPGNKLLSSNLFCFRGDSAFRPLLRDSPIHFEDSGCLCKEHQLECGHHLEINFDNRASQENPLFTS